MIEEILLGGILATLVYNATKLAVLNDISHQIRDLLTKKQCGNCEHKKE